MQFKKILLAVDADPVAAYAARTGLDLARALGAEIALIHVTDPSLGLGATDAGIVGEDIINRDRKLGARVMADFCERVGLASGATRFIPEGPPALKIVQAASEWIANLIVIGSHGRRGIRRALLGSVAEAVVRQPPCPVLVVK